jgi:lysyl-tRNA synthetase class 2
MQIPEFEEIIEPNDQTAARTEHLNALRELVGNVYPNKFARSTVSGTEDTITNILHFAPVVEIVAEIKAVVATLAERERPPAEIKDALNARLKDFGNVRIAGRLTTPPRGNFVHLTDGMNKLQIYAKKGTFALVKNDADNSLDDENGWAAFGLLDHGDFIGVEGFLFITNTGELSVHVEKLQFLSKAMLPMPDKMHGIADSEIKQRQRYVDLIGSSLRVESQESGVESELTTREVFERRAKIISSMRHFLEDHGYIEVETPMLTPKATGAAAKPFKTHHNALDIDLYARIAPELYLKRLVVGGFEKVYELNRNFRNEGISYKHNPEFTMLEFYCAYMDVEGMMNFCEELMRQAVQKATDGLKVTITNEPVADRIIDFSKFERLSMRDAVIKYWQSKGQKMVEGSIEKADFDDVDKLRRWFLLVILTDQFLRKSGLNLATILNYDSDEDIYSEDIWTVKGAVDALSPRLQYDENAKILNENLKVRFEETIDSLDSGIAKVLRNILDPTCSEDHQKARIIQYLFEGLVEGNLIQPTFVIDYPKSISPLSKASPDNPNIAERFELFINGMEVANGFSELNDPKEQYDRFIDQMSERERGDEEAMILDEDYIRALSYGMPPAAGIGIGIDRLVMLLTNKHSIRDVILFPHMRPEKNSATEDTE